MNLLAIIFSSCIVAAFAAPRIIGGQDAPDGKYPYMVSLRRITGNKLPHTCGGSILNKRWILTAAHCVEGIKNDSRLVVAGTNLIHGGKEQVYRSEYVVAHESFRNPPHSNDVGLIRVSEDIEFNDKVQPIRLPKEDFTKAGYPATATGWGTIEAGESPNELQELHLKIVDQNECKKVYEKLVDINNSHICSFSKQGEGLCNGDSGSALVVDGVQVGIASFVRPCALGSPDVYARVYTFLDWIDAQQAKF